MKVVLENKPSLDMKELNSGDIAVITGGQYAGKIISVYHNVANILGENNGFTGFRDLCNSIPVRRLKAGEKIVIEEGN